MNTDAGSEPERDTDLARRDEDPDAPATQAWAFEQLVELERQRVEGNNRRTDVALKAIAANDAADKRQYEYHVERLRQDSKDRNERHRSVVKLLWATLGVTVLVGGFVFYMLFFGNDAQRAVARDLLTTIGTAVGGAGAIWVIKSAIQRLFDNRSRDD